MTRRLVLAMTLVAGLVALALAIPLAGVSSSNTRNAFISDLTVSTLSTASLLASQPESKWAQTVEATSQETGARVVVVDTDRILIADSSDTDLDRTFDRPEIDAALAGQLTSDVRFSDTLNTDLRYTAAPIVQGYSIVAAVRLSLPESEVEREVRSTQMWLSLFILAVITAAALLAWLIARSIAAPLQRLSHIAAALPDDLSLRASESDGPEEVRAVAEVLNRTAARLEGILQRTRRVAADASHHLRTPLTGVRLRLEAVEDISTEDQVREQASAALVEVDRLAHRIDQVLDLSRTDAGASTLVTVDASDVVLDRTAAASVIAEERDLELTTEVPAGVQVTCAPGELSRTLDELLGNAFAYARTRVSVRLTVGERNVHLVVADDGPGLDPTEFERVFTRFVRGQHSVPGGSGLGLALVRESARAAGGDAVARRSPHGGLEVDVTWPRP